MIRSIFIALIILVGAAGYYGYQIKQETVKQTFHPSGQIHTELRYEFLPYLTGKRVGVRRSWHANGVLAEEITVVDGKPHGPGKTWYDDGKIRSEDHFVNGMLDGEIKRYLEDGKYFSINSYAQGKLNGRNVFYYPNGKLRMEGTYKDNLQHGVVKMYTEAGLPFGEQTFVNGKNHGPGREFYPDGSVKGNVNYVNGIQEGLNVYYHPDGSHWADVQYKNGQRDGTCHWWYRNGERDQTNNYRAGKYHGLGIWYSPTGRIQYEMNYSDGKKHGESKDYYWNGTLSRLSHYHMDKFHGEYKTYYYDSGELLEETNYRYDLLDGPYKIYDKDGHVLIDLVFAEGDVQNVVAIDLPEDRLQTGLMRWKIGKSFDSIIQGLFAAADYATLNRMADSIYGDTKLRSELYHLFIEGVSEGIGNLTPSRNSGKFYNQIEEWEKAYPDSPAPKLVRARAAVTTAWKFRGGDFAAATTRPNFERFHEELRKAERMVKKLAETHPENPELYRIWLTVGMGLSYDKQTMYRIFEQGKKADALYRPLYGAMVTAILPRWGGMPGEVERFVLSATEDLPEHDRKWLRGYMIGSVIGYTGPADFLNDFRFDKEMMLDTMGYYATHRPHSALAKNRWAWLCYLNKDKRRARDAFRLIDDDVLKGPWGDPEAYLAARDWAASDEAESPVSDIHLAIRRGDLVDPYLYIKNGKDLNLKDTNGDPLLHVAIEARQWAILDMLIEAGADLKATDGSNEIALHAAVREANRAAVKSLIEHGSPVANLFDTQTHPIHSAASKGLVAIARLILSEDSGQLNKTGWDNNTPLLYACSAGQLDFIRFLDGYPELDWSATRTGSHNCLHLAAKKGSVETVRYILDHHKIDPAAVNDEGLTAADVARKSGLEEIARLVDAAVPANIAE